MRSSFDEFRALLRPWQPGSAARASISIGDVRRQTIGSGGDHRRRCEYSRHAGSTRGRRGPRLPGHASPPAGSWLRVEWVASSSRSARASTSCDRRRRPATPIASARRSGAASGRSDSPPRWTIGGASATPAGPARSRRRTAPPWARRRAAGARRSASAATAADAAVGLRAGGAGHSGAVSAARIASADSKRSSGSLRSARLDDRDQRLGHVRTDLAEIRHRRIALRDRRRHRLSLVERRAAGEHLEQHDAGRVDVGRSADRPSVDLLRGEVLRRAEELAGVGQPGRRRSRAAWRCRSRRAWQSRSRRAARSPASRRDGRCPAR